MNDPESLLGSTSRQTNIAIAAPREYETSSGLSTVIALLLADTTRYVLSLVFLPDLVNHLRDVAAGRKEFQGEVTESTVASPALTGFLESLPPSDNGLILPLHPWVDPDTEESKRASRVCGLLQLLNFEKWRCVESQIRRGYEHLVKNYKVDSQVGPNGTRDGIYLFGDAEGALAAIAVARIVANVGILQSVYWEDEADEAIDLGQRSLREDWEDFSILRCFDTRVELLGLWTNDKALPSLEPVRGPSGIANVYRYSRFARERCGQYFSDLRELFSIADDGSIPNTNGGVGRHHVSPSPTKENATRGNHEFDLSNADVG
ncbi:hypothetical protein ACEPAG_8368 [Sanghuangporus baumii]